MYFQWAQSKHVIPAGWKKLITKNSDASRTHMFHYHIIRENRIFSPDKLTSEEINSILILDKFNKKSVTTFDVYTLNLLLLLKVRTLPPFNNFSGHKQCTSGDIFAT